MVLQETGKTRSRELHPAEKREERHDPAQGW